MSGSPRTHWRRVKGKDVRSGNCPKCGTWRQSLHRDHIIPVFKGGSNEPENLQYICANCHEDKTRGEIKEWVPKKRSLETCKKLSDSIASAYRNGAYSEEIRERQNLNSHSEEAKQKRLATRAKTRLLTPQQRLEKQLVWQEKQLEKLKRQLARETAK